MLGGLRVAGFVATGLMLLACGDDVDDGPSSGGSGGNADSGTTSAGGGGGGNDGTGGGPVVGDPIEAPANTWTWVDFPEASCRDGSTTGIGVNLNPDATEVLIYLQGGGACWNSLTCQANPSTFGAAEFGGGSSLASGIFSRSNAANPVANWNHVFVPYCTGDVHSGSNPDGMIGGQPQRFVGYDNMEAYLKRLVPTFPNATKVLLAGASAGGFGASGTSYLVQQYFGPVEVVTLNDSGPAMRGDVLAPCLQTQWRDTWGLDETFLGACGDNCPDKTDFLVDYVRWVSEVVSPDRRWALMSTRSDDTIRFFFGLGENNCASFTAMDAARFSAGLDALADEVQPNPNFGIFYAPGTSHTFLRSPSFYSTEVDGVVMADFVRDLVDGSTQQVR